MILRITTFILLIFIWSCHTPRSIQNTDRAQISTAELIQHVSYLASDSLQGRKPGLPGNRMAAEYIRRDLQKNGLALDLQSFEVISGVDYPDENRLTINGRYLQLFEEFRPVPFSADGEVSSPLCFVGYGFQIKNDSMHWDDYTGIDVQGKVVLILRGDPDIDKDSSRFRDQTSLRSKVIRARDNGASAVIFVSGSHFDKQDHWLPFRSEDAMIQSEIPVIQLKRSLVDSLLLLPLGMTVDSLEKYLIDQQRPRSIVLNNVAVELHTRVTRTRASTWNVVALLPGNDPALKEEYLVIGAHYDHLGFGGPGTGSRRPDTNAVHNGADDNASGTAALLEIAEKFASQRGHLRRSLLFVAFSAEEMGLLGSKYFVEHPPVPLQKIRYMINMDMIGRYDSSAAGLVIGGTGTAKGMQALIDSLAQSYPLKINHSPEGFGPSDHASFYTHDIPVLFFFTGVHEDYHTPSDDADRIDYRSEATIARFVAELVEELANRENTLAFQLAGPKEVPQSKRRLKVTLGIMPDFAGMGQGDGLRVDAVMPNRPAARAGMQKGDVIIAIEGEPVKNIYDYMERLNGCQPGQRISVDVQRKGQKIVLIVQL